MRGAFADTYCKEVAQAVGPAKVTLNRSALQLRDRFILDEDVYLDRKNGVLTFEKSAGRVLVCKSGITIAFPDLVSALSKYVEVDQASLESYMTPEVAGRLRTLGIIEDRQTPGRTAGRKAESQEPSKPLGEPNPNPKTGPVPESEPEPEPQPAEPKKPSAKVEHSAGRLKQDVLGKLGNAGAAAVASGEFDETIREVLEDVRRDLKPKQILPQISREGGSEKQNGDDRVAQATLASQAFGEKFELSEEELFLLSKAALLNGLKEQERKNLPAIKRNLLSSSPSPSFKKRLLQAYREIRKWLDSQKVDPAISEAVEHSQFIYSRTAAQQVSTEALLLALTDAFLTLKESGEKLLAVEEILTEQIRNTTPQITVPLDRLRSLIEESCYNYYCAPSREGSPGGDYCAFTRLDRNYFGLLIFDVSGHDQEASRIREELVGFLPRIRNPGNPAEFANQMNNFMLEGDFPESRFVSLLYGVLELANDKFEYVNAGHNPPFLVRNDRISAVKKSDLLLNVSPYTYTNYQLELNREDCLVFYTDGLTEAKKKTGPNELFGTGRLRETLSLNNVRGMKAKRALNTIMNVVSEEGFEVEDDITVQVYRHL